MAKIKGYRKIYRLRAAVPGAKSLEVTFPYEVVEREAGSRGLTIPEFLKQFHAVAEYDNFEGVIYTFEERPSGSEKPKRMATDSSGKG